VQPFRAPFVHRILQVGPSVSGFDLKVLFSIGSHGDAICRSSITDGSDPGSAADTPVGSRR
jgi:hypothetical protein